MAKKNSNRFIDVSFLVFSGLAVITGALSYLKGEEFFLKGVDASVSMFMEVLPRLLAAFGIAGFIEVLMPREAVTKWIGEKSGFKGILVASLGGALTPGGPIASFPLISALYRLGADFGPLVAYLTAWVLIALQRILIWEIPLMGVKFALLRLCASFTLPILAGLTARSLALRFEGLAKRREVP